MQPRPTRVPEAPLKIVSIGGGTGLSTLLHGLKLYKHCRPADPCDEPDIDITAIVTVTDDGGSSGRLRRELEVLPPGDIRNCLVALSEDETLLSRLFQYRFASGRGLKGHSFGNLFLTAMTHVTGDFPQAVRVSSEVLATCGHIFPSTTANVALEATLANGTRIQGETRISRSRSPIRKVRLKPARCKPIPETLEAIRDADLITFGPGSLFTSVIPNLLVPGIAEALAASRARKACFVNLMWQPGETMNFTASDHIRAIHEHARRRIVDLAILNTKPFRQSLLKRYRAKQALPVENDLSKLAAMGVKVVAQELVLEGPKIRHDSAKIAGIAIHLAGEARQAVRRR